ncbi:MAG TPA: hypothetical protein VGI34_02160 [Candidatus Acidoferrales bacterium]
MMVFAFFLIAVYSMLARDTRAEPQNTQIRQDQSVVDAARRSREVKKNATAPAKVITDDDLVKEPSKTNRENLDNAGLTSPTPDLSKASAIATTQAPGPGTISPPKESRSLSDQSEMDAEEDAEIAELKNQLASAQNALTWQKRELLLEQSIVYSNPVYTTTGAGKSELESMQLQIDELQQEVESLKGLLADLEWRRWRRTQAGNPDNGSRAEDYRSLPPSALVLPQP